MFMMPIGRAALLSSAVFLFAGAAGAATLTPIAPAAGYTDVAALGINNNGALTGSVYDADGNASGFVRDASGNYTVFNIAGSNFVQGRAISSTGAAVGYYLSDTGDQFSFMRSASGTITTLTNPNNGWNLYGIAQGINSSGVVVGDDWNFGRQGYLLDTNTNNITYLSATSGFDRTAARGIADNGTVVGFEQNSHTGALTGFVYSGTTMVPIDYPGAVTTVLEGINNAGLAVGNWLDNDGVTHGFSVDINDLNSLVFTNIDAPYSSVYDPDNVPFTQTFGVNDDGVVAITSSAGSFLYTPGGVEGPNGEVVFAPVEGANVPDGTNQYNFAVVEGQTYYIDPAASSGFTYAAGDGPYFASVTVTSDATLWLFQSGHWVQIASLLQGQSYTFDQGGVGQFQLRDINDPGDHYVTGVSFAGSGVFNGIQAVIGGVPEPTSWAMMLAGFGLVGGAMRRRQRTAVTFG
jgi:hypothetical protein